MPLQIAGVAQLVEHNLAKVGVADSSSVSRSEQTLDNQYCQVFLFLEQYLYFGFTLLENSGKLGVFGGNVTHNVTH